MNILSSFTKAHNYANYADLIKPSWAPPSFLFGPIWTVLYLIIIYTFGKVFFMWRDGSIPFVVLLPFIINIAANLAFTPIQFGLKNNLLASVDIVIVLISLAVALIAIYPYSKWVAYANIPYLGWVIFATCLQLTITYLNA